MNNASTPPADRFNIEKSFAVYLQVNELHQDRMPVDVYLAYKQAFFAGFSDLLMTLSHDIADMSDDEGVAVLDSLIHQVEAFWLGEGSGCPESLKEKAAIAVANALK